MFSCRQLAFIATKGFAERAESAWISLATSSLPVPVSPSISTGTFDVLTRETNFCLSFIFLLSPMSLS
jgi:hypothetical protein